jgi:hypothetical protein
MKRFSIMITATRYGLKVREYELFQVDANPEQFSRALTRRGYEAYVRDNSIPPVYSSEPLYKPAE